MARIENHHGIDVVFFNAGDTSKEVVTDLLNATGGFFAQSTETTLTFGNLFQSIGMVPKTKYFIGVIEDFTQYLKPETVSAMIAHEAGHVVKGHLDIRDTLPQQNGVCGNLEIELEADAYAASIYGPKAIIDALHDLFGTYIRKCGSKDKTFEEHWNNLHVAMPHNQPRYDALNKLIAQQSNGEL